MTSRWLLVFSVLISMIICWSASDVCEPIWFNIRLNGTTQVLDVDGKVACQGSKLISSTQDTKKATQYWRWYKGMLINKKNGLVLDVKNGLKTGNELMLNYGHHLRSQCWTMLESRGIGQTGIGGQPVTAGPVQPVTGGAVRPGSVVGTLSNCDMSNMKISIPTNNGGTATVAAQGSLIELLCPPARSRT